MLSTCLYFVVPPPSVLEPSEQNVVDNNIPTEQLIHEEESLVQFGNETELVENDDGVERNAFDFIDTLILEPLYLTMTLKNVKK